MTDALPYRSRDAETDGRADDDEEEEDLDESVSCLYLEKKPELTRQRATRQ